ncbi:MULTISPECIES: DUF1214 domain-containing protein [Xanthobacter]|uniref:DUF1214 domain-containing protein n=1 Tax=Xanthobacter TaxID=279 RepID=UPI001F23883F
MRLLPLAFTLLVAIALGLGVTLFMVTHSRGLDVVQAGPWQGWPRSGTVKADPYSRAAVARSGELPLELADGLLFLATTDDKGRPIDGRCETRITGTLPQARLWTLAVMDEEGRFIPNDAERYGLTSSEALYRADGALDIRLSPRARPGNWLPTGARGRLQVALRLYDAPFSFASGAGDATTVLPHIVQEACP